MQVFHTAGAPPNQGRICLAITGCTRNSRKAERKMVDANTGMCGLGLPHVQVTISRGGKRPQYNGSEKPYLPKNSPLLRSKLFWVAVLYFSEGFPFGVFFDVLPV